MKPSASILTALVLASLLFASCSSTEVSDDTQTAAASAATETTEDRLPDALPADLDLGGQTIRFLSYESYIKSEDSGDIVFAAVYQAGLAVQERLNVVYEFNIQPANDVDDLAYQSILAGSDDYDIVTPLANSSTTMSSENLLYHMSDLEYVDLSKPWWCTDYMSSVALDANDPSILLGAFSYNYLERSSVITFNQRLLQNVLDKNAQDLYQTALDGGWTIDYMQSLCKDFYQDLNGNASVDSGDQIPFLYNPTENFRRMIYSAGVTFTDRDDSGYPVIDMNKNETVTLVEKMIDLYTTNGVLNTDDFPEDNSFVEGRALFSIGRFADVAWTMRDMEDDFGFLPYPKLDERIDNYYSITDAYAMVLGVPVTVAEPVPISAVLEAMASEGYHSVRPVYYEEALKIKYSRDDTASQIIDLITENCRTDFLFLNSLDGLGDVFNSLILKKSTDFASQYSRVEKRALKQLASLIEAYEES